MRRAPFILRHITMLRHVAGAITLSIACFAPLIAQLPPLPPSSPGIPSAVPRPFFGGPRAVPSPSSPVPAEETKSGSEATSKKPPPPVTLDPRSVQVDFADGSQLRLLLADERVEIETPHGKLAVPAEKVQRLEFAPRISAEATARLKELLPKISSPTVAEREPAVREILALGEGAIPAVEELAKDAESETAEYAADLLAKLKKPLPKGRTTRGQDLIETADSRIFGHVTMPELKVATTQFGMLSMRVRDVRSIRSLALVLADASGDADDAPDDRNALPDPGNLSSFAGQVGKTLYFRVTGAADSTIWGTDIYTTDSDLSTAAVHAGAVQLGRTAVVRVKILAGQAGFAGSSRNGVASNSYDSYPSSYEIVTKRSR